MSPTLPPPIPNGPQATAPAWSPNMDGPLIIDHRVAPGTEGLTLSGIREEVLKGGRFVIYTYVFSILVLTFRRSSGIRFLRSGQDGTGRALGYSVLSLLLGPWGLPWGLIWTPASIFTNLSGGKDVTHELLRALVGDEEAANVIFARQKRSAGWGMILLRTVFISAPVALLVFFIVSVRESEMANRKLMDSPGYPAFQAADRAASSDMPDGNTADARTAAKLIADHMKRFLDEFVTYSGRGTRPSHICGAWCEIRSDRCIVILRVPDLSRYDSSALGVLAEAAWMDALNNLQGVPGMNPGIMLHVGLRGEFDYDSVMSGRFTKDVEAKPDSKLDAKETRRSLVEWFGPSAS